MKILKKILIAVLVVALSAGGFVSIYALREKNNQSNSGVKVTQGETQIAALTCLPDYESVVWEAEAFGKNGFTYSLYYENGKIGRSYNIASRHTKEKIINHFEKYTLEEFKNFKYEYVTGIHIDNYEYDYYYAEILPSDCIAVRIGTTEFIPEEAEITVDGQTIKFKYFTGTVDHSDFYSEAINLYYFPDFICVDSNHREHKIYSGFDAE